LELERAPIVREVPVVVHRTNCIVRCSCTGARAHRAGGTGRGSCVGCSVTMEHARV
jgi:hypothetical protein